MKTFFVEYKKLIENDYNPTVNTSYLNKETAVNK